MIISSPALKLRLPARRSFTATVPGGKVAMQSPPAGRVLRPERQDGVIVKCSQCKLLRIANYDYEKADLVAKGWELEPRPLCPQCHRLRSGSENVYPSRSLVFSTTGNVFVWIDEPEP